MISCLLHFDDEAAAIAALPGLRISPVSAEPPHAMQPDRWAATVLPVALVTAEAVYGPIDAEMRRELISPRETLQGFWLLAATASDLPGIAAEIEPETGRFLSGDDAVLGARIDPVFAGMAAVPLW